MAGPNPQTAAQTQSQTPPKTLPPGLEQYDYNALEEAYNAAQEGLRSQPTGPKGSLGRDLISFADALKIKDPTFGTEVQRIILQGSPAGNRGLTGPSLSQIKAVSRLETQASEAETRAKEEQAKSNAFLAFTLSETGASLTKDPTTGAYSVTVDPKHPFQVSKALKEKREQDALTGNLPVPGGLEEDIRKGEAALNQRLLDQLGPGYATSTPGQTALAEFNKQANLARDSARRGDIQQFAGLNAAARGEAGSVQPNLAYAGLYGQATGIQQGLLGYQTGQQGLGIQNYQFDLARRAEEEAQKSRERMGFYGAVGQLAGAAAGGYAAYKTKL